MEVLAQSPSKFALTDLTMRSMIELERAKAGLDYEVDVLVHLSTALLESYEDGTSAATFTFIEPSLYEPYERLVRGFDASEQPKIVRIQSYIRHMSQELSLVADGNEAPVVSLIPACTRLHRELLNEINSEVAFDINDWPSVAEGASPGVSAS